MLDNLERDPASLLGVALRGVIANNLPYESDRDILVVEGREPPS